MKNKIELLEIQNTVNLKIWLNRKLVTIKGKWVNWETEKIFKRVRDMQEWEELFGIWESSDNHGDTIFKEIRAENFPE